MVPRIGPMELLVVLVLALPVMAVVAQVGMHVQTSFMNKLPPAGYSTARRTTGYCRPSRSLTCADDSGLRRLSPPFARGNGLQNR
jgi:hypothetical protein